MRALLLVVAPLRLSGLLLLVLSGLLITLLVFPWLAQASRNRVVRGWSWLLLAACGARLRVSGLPLAADLAATGIRAGSRGRLLLANHVSWIDVFALDAALPCRFVAKAEIGRWPLLGALVTLAGTLYIERGRRHAVHAMNHRVRDRLRAGESVAVFAEGTTTDGSELLPFHSNLIAPALEVGCDVWPVALRYTEDGAPTTAAAFVGEMGLTTSLWNIVTARRLAIEVAFLTPVPATGEPKPTRHQLAQAAREEISRHLGLAAAEVSRAPAPADRAAATPSAAASESR